LIDLYREALNTLRVAILLWGSLVIFVGIAQAVLETLRSGSGQAVAGRIVSHTSLGLEFFVGATILNLILHPTWIAVAATVLTIVTRKLVTLSLGRAARR
jgi:uncharacterized membrane protein